ncbi:MAG: STAS domain-containing protein [Solirubrobacterales bacterium]
MNIAPFNVEVQSVDGGVGAFVVTGELDQATAGELREPLQEAINGGTRAVMIDMTDCGFIDSTGLGVIVEAWKALEDRDGDGREVGLSICCPEPEVRRLMEVTGLDQAISILNTREEAIAALQP